MKTKALLLTCILMVFGFARLSAQWPPVIPEGTRSIVWTFPAAWDEIINCNGQEVTIHMDMIFKETDLFQNGELQKGINHVIYGEGVNESTGETFKINLHMKGYPPVTPEGNYTTGISRYNLVGDQGSHYMVSLSFYDQEPWFSVDKFVCLAEDKKK